MSATRIDGKATGQDNHADAPFKYVSRDEALTRLSDTEAARVSAAEALGQLSEGDEYLDLHHLDHGVRIASGNARAIGGVLPRKSISAGTWLKLIAQTPPSPPAATAASVMEQRGRIRRAP
jgi:hypothetical protein